jgi:hypothetical protein
MWKRGSEGARLTDAHTNLEYKNRKLIWRYSYEYVYSTRTRMIIWPIRGLLGVIRFSLSATRLFTYDVA